MNYEEAIAYWFQRIDYERRSPQPADLKLDRMRYLLRMLGQPHRAFPIVHIAGSKGKGSTAAMLASVLIQSGLRTGLFTSPHLVEVEERIQVNNAQVSHGELTALIEEIQSAIAGQSTFPDDAFTFFEIATALGFLHFAHAKVDIAVVEVGLGGRFDSTNVCDPIVSVITSISFDHVAQLGSTLAKIAREKAGIIKPRRPLISGVLHRPARSVIEDGCREKRSELIQLGRDFHFRYEPAKFSNDEQRMPRVSVTGQTEPGASLRLGLIGEHQAANASLVVSCVKQLRKQGFAIPDQAVSDGLANVKWPARFEVVGQDPWLILDCAHNKASAKALLKTLRTSFPCFRSSDVKRCLVFAGSREKDLRAMLQLLTPHFTHVCLTSFANNPRCVPPEQLVEFLPDSVSYSMHATSESAWNKARAYAGENDLICVTGSVFLAGEIESLLANARQPLELAAE